MSGWVELDQGQPVRCGHSSNAAVLAELAACRSTCELLAVEWLYTTGKPAGQDLYLTALWAGRFVEAWPHVSILISKPTINLHLCGDPRARVPQVRQVLIDRFGSDRTYKGVRCPICKGKGWRGREHTPCPIWEVAPGPLKEFTVDHHWAALAVAVTSFDRGLTCGIVMGGSSW
jgi:hypothetical protein